jgi:hypothetical protein
MTEEDFILTPGEPVACPSCQSSMKWKICDRCRRPGFVRHCECTLPAFWEDVQLLFVADGDAVLAPGWYCHACRTPLN